MLPFFGVRTLYSDATVAARTHRATQAELLCIMLYIWYSTIVNSRDDGRLYVKKARTRKDSSMRNRWNVLYYILAGMLLGSTIGAHIAAESESPMQLVQRLVQAIIRMKPANNGKLSNVEQTANATIAKE